MCSKIKKCFFANPRGCSGDDDHLAGEVRNLVRVKLELGHLVFYFERCRFSSQTKAKGVGAEITNTCGGWMYTEVAF